MTKEAVLQLWFGSFGLTAYQEDAVPTGENKPAYPYLTYEMTTDAWGEVIPLAVSLWYRTTSWLPPNRKAEEISEAISRGGIYLPCESGAIRIQRGNPFARSTYDEADDQVRRKILNIMVEYLTED